MKWRSKALSVLLSAVLICFCSCDKVVIEPKENWDKVSAEHLTGTGKTLKFWYFSQIKVAYYTASGVLDSVINVPLTDKANFIYFTQDIYGLNVSLTQYPATKFIPIYAYWSLDYKNQKLRFICNNTLNSCGEERLEPYWTTRNYGVSSSTEGFALEQVTTLPQNRKKIITMWLIASSQEIEQ